MMIAFQKTLLDSVNLSAWLFYVEQIARPCRIAALEQQPDFGYGARRYGL